MANMSYCRFQNTLNDLRDCERALDDIVSGDGTLSREELAAARQLVEVCRTIAELSDEDLGDDVLDENRVEEEDEE